MGVSPKAAGLCAAVAHQGSVSCLIQRCCELLFGFWMPSCVHVEVACSSVCLWTVVFANSGAHIFLLYVL